MSKFKQLLKLGAVAAFAAIVLAPFYGMASQPRDFDDNAVMYGGAYSHQELVDKIENGDTKHSSANLKQIYFNENRGITPENITKSVDGAVRKDGTVWVNGKQVASNVWSSGRNFIQGSQKDGSIWMRPTSVSFVSSELPAFVKLDANGNFEWAIIKSCGNPVREIERPFGQIYKRVINLTKDADTNHAADDKEHALVVDTEDELRYDITITNNGTGDMTNTVMTDTLPEGVVLKSDPSKRSFTVDAFGTIAPNKSKTYTLTVKVTSDEAGKYIVNEACFTADKDQKGCDTAVIRITPEDDVTPQAAFQCVDLTKKKIGDLQYRFTAKADVENTDIEAYVFNFGDGNSKRVEASETTATTTHTYAKEADYTATVVVKTGEGTTDIVSDCKVVFTAQGDDDDNGDDNGGKQPPKGKQPEQLPRTGIESGAAALMGSGALGYSARAYLRSKRGLLDALMGDKE